MKVDWLRLVAWTWIVFLPGASMHAVPRPAEDSVDLVMPNAVSPQLSFALEDLRAAIKGIRLTARTVDKPDSGELSIIIGERSVSASDSVPAVDSGVPSSPESYVISVPNNHTVVIKGSDPTGEMYGVLDLAEQIQQEGESAFVEKIRPVSRSPYLAVRGINMFLTPQGFDDPQSWYWSDSYWRDFLDALARDRYNFLDFHGPFDLTVAFPNGFSFFIYLPEFPEVGVGVERAKQNLTRFQQIIQWAAQRGIKVGFMNYSAAAPVGPWKTGEFWKDVPWVPRRQDFLEGSRLETYTREAVEVFLKAVPGLWMFGFRIGESGQPEDFYKKTYLQALTKIPNSLNVYVRTWQADPAKVREISTETPHSFYIEPKYNAEHLGLPYQAVTGGRQYSPSGSWEDYTNYPRKYQIIWQIRASGTHRIFHWGSPQFARRTVRSCKFGGGIGFSMEPPNAYSPQADYIHNNPATDHKWSDWVFQEQWFWYMVWGRTAYDPDVSDKVWLREFNTRFGSQAGPLAYEALVESSKVVPFIYSYHNQGLDQVMFAPEFETGDHAWISHAGGVAEPLWQGKRVVPYGPGNLNFLRVGVLDRTAMVDPVTYVDNYINQRLDGRMTPVEAAGYLDSATDKSEALMNKAADLHSKAAKEFDCLRMDIDAVAWLGRYYRDRIQSVTHLQFYLRTEFQPELTSAYEYLERAVNDWDQLSGVTDRHFGHVPELIRMRPYKFTWREEGRSLGVDLNEINDMEYEARQVNRTRSGTQFVIGHLPPLKIRPSQPFTVEASFASDWANGDIGSGFNINPSPGNIHMFLFYRNSQESAYKEIPLRSENAFERTWSATVPAQDVTPGYLEYYFAGDAGGVEGDYGSTLQRRPPYVVLVNTNNTKPQVSHVPPSGAHERQTITLEVTVIAGAAIDNVRVLYKRMPAAYEWIPATMKHVGQDRYQVSVPMTPEGLLYYFQASDTDGNTVRYPDFLQQTPYFVLDSWPESDKHN